MNTACLYVDVLKAEMDIFESEETVRQVIIRALRDPDTKYNELKKDHLLNDEMLVRLKNGPEKNTEKNIVIDVE